MTHPTNTTTSTMTIRSLRTVFFALIGGVALFLIVAIAIAPLRDAADPAQGGIDVGTMLIGVLVLLVASNAMIAYFIRRSALQSVAADPEPAIEQLEGGDIPPRLASMTLILGALAESIAILGAVTYMLEAETMALVFACFGLGALVFQIPSRARLIEAVRAAAPSRV